MENKCSHESCNYEPHHDDSCGQEHGHEDHCKKDEHVKMWVCAFHEAMYEAKVDILKAKILKSWNSKLEKSADAVFETMEIKWKAKSVKEKAKEDLKERLAKIMAESKA